MSRLSLQYLRRVSVTIVGFAVLAIGIAMVVLPGPAVVVIPIGLGILASEFAWARHLLRKLRHQLKLCTAGNKSKDRS
jgi:tellurite resistance protein TerC